MAAEARLHRLRARLSDSHLWARRMLHELGAEGAAALDASSAHDGWAAWRERTALGGDGAGGDADSLDEVAAARGGDSGLAGRGMLAGRRVGGGSLRAQRVTGR